MSTKAIITRRSIARSEAAAATEATEANNLGLTVEFGLPQGTLVSGTEQQYAKLEARGYRVKVLADTNILEVGSYRINTETTPPKVPAKLQIPKALKETWFHHLVQLVGPREEDWIKTIEARGVDVVEPVSAYGLFVVGSPEKVEGLKSLPFVAWVGPFKPAYRIAPNLWGLRGTIQYVNVGVYPDTETSQVRRGIEKAKGVVVNEWDQEGSYRDRYRILIVEVEAKRLAEIACLPAVRWLEYQSPTLTADDERSTQTVAENLNGAAPPNTAPVIGYQAALAGLGLSGAGVVVGICDSGVDTNNNAAMHPDLVGRMAFFVDQTGGITPTDVNGHGTHVAGIAVGNAATRDTDPQGFLLGQGMAPGANFGVLNPVDTAGSPGTGPVATFTQLMVNNGAHVMNNSWRQGGGGGYTANAALVDQLVRDPNNATAMLDYLVIVFSAGNSGPGASTITPPKEAKNPIVVGNSLNFRPGEGDADDIRGINQTSSRGPAVDGRMLPTIVAPGTDIISARPTVDIDPTTLGVQRPRTPYTDTGAVVHNNHTRMSGTSMAAPHVTGLCALLIEWWRNRTNGKNPSPALLKALLVNGAEDLVGGPDGNGGNLTNIPNNDQGWGRVSLENIALQAPASDRGPKIFSDQRHAFTSNGQEHTIRIAPFDTTHPMRITLVWTDAPGAANANPALVNDLDLEVRELATGNVYRGNVFANGFSITGGSFDDRNNIECVYIQNPSGTYEVSIIAANIAISARPDIATPWQDFALVIDNAEVPAAAPVSVVPIIDRSGSMVASGYVDITKTSSKQFIDLMGVDDKIAVVSFGSTSKVEYPTGAGPALQTITGQPIRDAAMTEVDGIVFSGCTYMGAGINEAKNLLNPATGSRAMVLLSDGYDNKGCDPTNSAKPSALDAATGLPANMPIYTCAMGPASDQALLEQIATMTSGRYYYMPTIDDLFEIYNYIRGQVTGDAIVANESAMASSSRVAAFVDALASEATFTVAWADTKLRFVSSDPKKPNQVAVRLRDPRGQLIHPDCSYVRRTVGQGYVVFKLQEPAAGQWFVEVTTASKTHLTYTVGGFVRSPLHLHVSLKPLQIIAGMPVNIAAQVFDGRSLITGFKASVQVARPTLGVANLMKKYKTQLKKVRPIKLPRSDTLPSDIGRLLALRTKMLKDDKPDLFAQTTSPVTLRSTTIVDLQRLRFDHLIPFGVTPVGPENIIDREVMPTVTPTMPAPVVSLHSSIFPSVLTGSFTNTNQQGSYNVVVTVNGASPVSKTRFVRKELVSVLVK
jgi:subtilisin family serine protease